MELNEFKKFERSVDLRVGDNVKITLSSLNGKSNLVRRYYLIGEEKNLFLSFYYCERIILQKKAPSPVEMIVLSNPQIDEESWRKLKPENLYELYSDKYKEIFTLYSIKEIKEIKLISKSKKN